MGYVITRETLAAAVQKNRQSVALESILNTAIDSELTAGRLCECENCSCSKPEPEPEEPEAEEYVDSDDGFGSPFSQ